MENNSYNYQSQNYQSNNNQYQQAYGQQYNQAYQQPYQYQEMNRSQVTDADYNDFSHRHLVSSILASAMCPVPVANLVFMILSIIRRREVIKYIKNGGMHTGKIKVISCLYRVGIYGSIACAAYYIFLFLNAIFLNNGF